METNEIMVNEELNNVEETETKEENSGKGLVIAAGIGLATLGGVLAYKYVVKPIRAKIKAHKEENVVYDEDFFEVDDDEDVKPEEETK